MDIIITDWALQSYLELKHGNVFTNQDYKKKLRLDVLLLHDYPNHPKFSENKFWGPAKENEHLVIKYGWKMKWHNIGNGKVQLRLLVAIPNENAYLCEAYVKTTPQQDFRKMARLKIKITKISENNYIKRGIL